MRTLTGGDMRRGHNTDRARRDGGARQPRPEELQSAMVSPLASPCLVWDCPGWRLHGWWERERGRHVWLAATKRAATSSKTTARPTQSPHVPSSPSRTVTWSSTQPTNTVNLPMTNTAPRLRLSAYFPRLAPRLAVLATLATLIASSGCMIWQQVPHTPRLENLNSQMVFSMVPPIPWTQVQADDPAHAPVDVQCGIGPSIGTADLYASVVVRGRPPTGQVAPLNVSLLIDRSEQIAGGRFGQMLSAAQAFVNQLRDGDRLSVIPFPDGVSEPLPPMVIAPNTRATAFAAIQSLQQYGRGNLEGGMLAGLVEVFGAFQPWQINQLVVFTDGRPERGLTTYSELTSLAAVSAEHGVGITTVGFGYEHNELLLLGLADASGGNYYYVDNPGEIAQLFQGDANALLSSVARAVDVDLTVPSGGAL